MELPEPLRFDPVPVRARHDGWSADDQRLTSASNWPRRAWSHHLPDPGPAALSHNAPRVLLHARAVSMNIVNIRRSSGLLCPVLRTR